MKEVSETKNFLSLDNIGTTNVGNTTYIHKFPMNFHPSPRKISMRGKSIVFSHL